METRKYVPTRDIISLDNLAARSGDSVIICIPASSWLIARKLLSTRGRYRTTYTLGDAGNNGYYIPASDDENYKRLLEEIAVFLEADDMSCDIVDALNNLNDTLEIVSQNVCCGANSGAGGAGLYETLPADYTDSGSNYPDDFGSRSEFDNYRCDAAEWIIRVIETDLIFLQNTDVTAITAAVLTASLLTPVPVDDVVALALLIAQLLAEATLDTALQALIDALGTHRQELRCALYNAISAADAKTSFDEWVSGKVTTVQETFLSYFINFDVLNALYEKVAAAAAIGADCSSCGSCDSVTVFKGSIDGDNTFTTALHTESNPDRHTVLARFNYDESSGIYCGPEVTITDIRILSGTPDSVPGDSGYRMWRQNGTQIYGSDSKPPFPLTNVGYFEILDNVAPAQQIVFEMDWE